MMKAPPKGPFRKVVDYARHFVKWEWCFGVPGASSVTLTLECGHTDSRKGNIPIPKKARCRKCGRLLAEEKQAPVETPSQGATVFPWFLEEPPPYNPRARKRLTDDLIPEK
jgi:hypothetical protein